MADESWMVDGAMKLLMAAICFAIVTLVILYGVAYLSIVVHERSVKKKRSMPWPKSWFPLQTFDLFLDDERQEIWEREERHPLPHEPPFDPPQVFKY